MEGTRAAISISRTLRLAKARVRVIAGPGTRASTVQLLVICCCAAASLGVSRVSLDDPLASPYDFQESQNGPLGGLDPRENLQ